LVRTVSKGDDGDQRCGSNGSSKHMDQTTAPNAVDVAVRICHAVAQTNQSDKRMATIGSGGFRCSGYGQDGGEAVSHNTSQRVLSGGDRFYADVQCFIIRSERKFRPEGRTPFQGSFKPKIVMIELTLPDLIGREND
jgi:hypothetical protein